MSPIAPAELTAVRRDPSRAKLPDHERALLLFVLRAVAEPEEVQRHAPPPRALPRRGAGRVEAAIRDSQGELIYHPRPDVEAAVKVWVVQQKPA